MRAKTFLIVALAAIALLAGCASMRDGGGIRDFFDRLDRQSGGSTS